MNWQAILTDLRERGWTQQLIADRIGASQAAISDLSSGKTKKPTYALGRALELLHDSNLKPAKHEPARAAA